MAYACAFNGDETISLDKAHLGFEILAPALHLRGHAAQGIGSKSLAPNREDDHI